MDGCSTTKQKGPPMILKLMTSVMESITIDLPQVPVKEKSAKSKMDLDREFEDHVNALKMIAGYNLESTEFHPNCDFNSFRFWR
jgi:hypothetical protein